MKRDKSEAEPVNVVVSYTVKPGKEKVFERTIHQTINAAHNYTGHLGATVIKDDDRRYHLIYRFSGHELLNKWLQSDERKQFLDKISGFVEDKVIEVQKITGFETWFKAPAEAHTASPPRWKMLLLTFLGAYPVVVLFQFLIAPHILKWNLFLRSLMFPIVILTTMTYLVMPVLTRWFRGWLYKPATSKKHVDQL
jgi:antibiotic biosynthesis monooxygenase (ABM) superfamily enzyme